MKNFILLFTLLLIGSAAFSQNEEAPSQWDGSTNTIGTIYRGGNVGIGLSSFSNNNKLTIGGDFIKGGNYLTMGDLVTETSRNFNFGISPTKQIGSEYYDTNGNLRYEFFAGATTSLGIRNTDASEIFKVAIDPVFGSFIHLPKTKSRMVIGDYGNYLLDDGHKLVVKEGSAMIEGNILTNANVGIGTDSFQDEFDQYRLSVKGRVRAEAVKVYTDWADFVFEDSYELPTLKEVEQHIIANGHLKDIPSAKTVEENGIELGEMNKLLLQKIEELTLYVIALNKEIETLKN